MLTLNLTGSDQARSYTPNLMLQGGIRENICDIQVNAQGKKRIQMRISLTHGCLSLRKEIRRPQGHEFCFRAEQP